MSKLRNAKVQVGLLRLRRIVGGVQNLATALTVGSRSTNMLIAGIGLQLADIGMKFGISTPEEIMETWSKVWVPPTLMDYWTTYLREHKTFQEKGYSMVTVNGVDALFWKDRDETRCFVETEDKVEAIKESFRIHLQQQFPIATISSTLYRYLFKEASFPKDERASTFQEEQWQRLLPFLRKGQTRSLGLIGPPGTGKSTTALYLAKRATEMLGGHVALLPGKEVQWPNRLQEFLEFYQPTVLIIQDIHLQRGSSSDVSENLAFLDMVYTYAKLIIFTSNTKLEDSVQEMIRPQRIDDLVYVGGAVPIEFTIPWIQSVDDETQEQIRKLPPSFSHELNQRVENYGISCLEKELADLLKRAALSTRSRPVESFAVSPSETMQAVPRAEA